jgi:hypothetical protein
MHSNYEKIKDKILAWPFKEAEKIVRCIQLHIIQIQFIKISKIITMEIKENLS